MRLMEIIGSRPGRLLRTATDVPVLGLLVHGSWQGEAVRQHRRTR